VRRHLLAVAVLVLGWPLAGLAAPAAVPVPFTPMTPSFGVGASWYGAGRLFGFTAGYAAGDNEVTVYALWDAAALYVAAVVVDQALFADVTARDAPATRSGDGVELLFDPQRTGGARVAPGDRAFRDYVFTITGGLLDAYGAGAGADPAFIGQAQAVTTPVADGGEGGYLMEIRVPWSDLGLTAGGGLAFGLDVVNHDRDGPAGTATILADAPGNLDAFDLPDTWPQLVLTGGPDGGAPPPPPADGPASGTGGTTGAGGQLPIPAPQSGCHCQGGRGTGAETVLALALLATLGRRRARR
jgi:hypothetical protein